MVDTATGDRVNLDDDERLDIADAQALQTLVYQYAAKLLGGLLGNAQGVVSNVGFQASDGGGYPVIDIGECMIYGSHLRSTAGNRTNDGIVIVHDPTASGQVSQLNAAAFEPAQQEPYVWAALQMVNTDADSRRYWNTGSGSEQSYSPNTRARQRVKFELALTEPATVYDSPWVAIGQVTAWVGSSPALPTVTAIHPFDQHPLAGGPDTDDIARKFAAVTGNDDVFGLNQAFTWILYEILRMKDTDAFSGNPHASQALNGPVNRGLYQLDEDLTTQEDLEAAIDSEGVRCLFRSQINWTDPSYTFYNVGIYPGITGSSLLTVGTGEVDVTVPGRAYTVHVTPVMPVASPPTEISKVATVGGISYDGGSNTSTFKVWLYDTSTTALTNQSFYLTVFGDPSP